VMYAQRHRLGAVQDRLAWGFGANTIYDGALAGLIRGSTWLTNTLQNGRLRTYFWCVIVTVLGGVGLTWGRQERLGVWAAEWTAPAAAEAVLIGLLIAAILAVVARQQDRLVAVIVLGSVGFLVSALYLVLSAPDLALTQLLIESVTIILFLLVLQRLPKSAPPTSPRRERLADAALAVVFGGVMTVLVLAVSAANAARPVAEFFTESSRPRAGGRNIVNVILVDFRGFDTLGEITVLGIAALGAFALIKLRRTR